MPFTVQSDTHASLACQQTDRAPTEKRLVCLHFFSEVLTAVTCCLGGLAHRMSFRGRGNAVVPTKIKARIGVALVYSLRRSRGPGCDCDHGCDCRYGRGHDQGGILGGGSALNFGLYVLYAP